MNLFKKLFSWNRKERDEKYEEISKRLGIIEEQTKEKKQLYRSRIKVGNNTIVVFNNGDTLSCEDKDNLFYNYCPIAIDESDIRLYYHSFVNKEEIQEQKVIEMDLLILRNNSDFVINGNKVYLKGINIPIPDAIVAEIIVNRENVEASNKEEFDDYYNRIIMFWAKLANSPVKDRDNVMTYCINNDIRLSKTGNIIAYRRVVKWDTKEEELNTELQDFVNEEYYKIVKKWKKKASDYAVYDSIDFKGYKLIALNKIATKSFQDINHNIIGNLADLKAEGCEKEVVQLYTSWHDSGKYVFSIPSLYKIDSNEVDVNVDNCHSGGLHGASVSYNYISYGDTPVVVLINPAKCIMVTPNYEKEKFRVSEMYIACINPNEHGVHINEALIEEADKVYNDMTIEELKQAFASKSMETLSIEENVPETSLVDVKNIVEILSKRIINL
jgi:hypothetical protein